MRFWATFIALGLSCVDGLAEQERPNVLFLSVDDLNDWAGCLGGHPQAKTPNIDGLAASGVLFEQAYCAAPLCNPSRTSVMTGLRPSTTGIYGNLNWFREVPGLENWVTLPQYFREHGYLAWSGGKIFHQAHGKWSDPESWDGQYSIRSGTQAPPEERRYAHGMRPEFANKILGRLIDWGAIEQPDEETADWKTAEGAAAFLGEEHEDPFFLACGIYRPHLSWYAPRKYFEMHPLEDVILPAVVEGDLEDVPRKGRAMAGPSFDIVRRHGEWKRAVQGYLAASSFADACVGHVLDALERSAFRDNTIVVLWGDHGYHIGEKRHIAKSALWCHATRTPLIVRLPGEDAGKGRCSRPVSLVDLYPTLVELCGLPPRDGIDGRSLAPLVRDPGAAWEWPALITHSPHWHGVNHAVRSEAFHFIVYSDGGEELYANVDDPRQLKNLAGDPEYDQAKRELKQWLPNENAEHYRGE